MGIMSLPNFVFCMDADLESGDMLGKEIMGDSNPLYTSSLAQNLAQLPGLSADVQNASRIQKLLEKYEKSSNPAEQAALQRFKNEANKKRSGSDEHTQNIQLSISNELMQHLLGNSELEREKYELEVNKAKTGTKIAWTNAAIGGLTLATTITVLILQQYNAQNA